MKMRMLMRIGQEMGEWKNGGKVQLNILNFNMLKNYNFYLPHKWPFQNPW